MDIDILFEVYDEFLYDYTTYDEIKNAIDGKTYKDVYDVIYDDLTRKGFTINEAKALVYTISPDEETIRKFIGYASRWYASDDENDLKELINSFAGIDIPCEEVSKIFEYRQMFKNTKRGLIQVNEKRESL